MVDEILLVWPGRCFFFLDVVKQYVLRILMDFLFVQRRLIHVNPPFGESILTSIDCRLIQMCQETSFRKAYGTDAIIMGTFGYSKDRVISPSFQGNLSHRNGDRTSLNDVGIL